MNVEKYKKFYKNRFFTLDFKDGRSLLSQGCFYDKNQVKN